MVPTRTSFRMIGSLVATAVLAVSCWAALPASAQCRLYTTDADFDLGVLQGVDHTSTHDQLQLNPTRTTFPFAWIANAEEGTVSKVDTQTGKELARYYTAPPTAGGAFGGGQSPSRTTVDRDGNCWVANRHFGGQASITEILVDGGIDRNTNSSIETSSDLNNDGVISGAELLPWGSDERVARHYLVGGGNGLARALTLDKTGFVWVGLFNEHRVIKFDPSLSSVTYAPLALAAPPELASISTSQTYGLARAPSGRLYLSTLSPVVEEIDPGAASGGTDPPRVLQSVSHTGTDYGIAVDGSGIVWLADITASRCIRWNPSLGAGGFTYGVGAPSRGRGITVDFDGNIWMACDAANQAAKYSPGAPPVLLGIAPAGCTFPIGIAIAADGNIIDVGQSSNSWGKIDKTALTTIVTGGPQTVGVGPYTYSDFTGSLSSILGKQGFWNVIHDGGAAGTKWGKVSWNSLVPESTSVTVQVRAADDSSSLSSQTLIDASNDSSFCTITGRYLEVRARLTTDRSDLGSPILYDLTVCPCNQNPDCSGAAACVATLWSPNHKYQPVSICGVTDPDGDPVTITVTGITQDEPLNTRGDGNTCPDGQIVAGQASVRAERTGTPGIPGNGRVYVISFTASDGKGGQCSGQVSVCVPHDQGAHSTCIDDGQKYNSLGPCNGGSSLSQEITEVGFTVGEVTGSQAALEFALPQDTHVELSVFDVTGRRLATVENGTLAAGLYQRSWDMSGATKGLYFVRLRAGAVTLTRTVVKAR